MPGNNIIENGYRDTESDSVDSDIIIHRSRKARPIEFDSEINASTSTETEGGDYYYRECVDASKSKFFNRTKSDRSTNFSNIFELIQVFKLFFTDQLVDEII